MPSGHETLAELKKENRELQRALQLVTIRARDESLRADLALRSAADAWTFARALLRVGRPAHR